MKVVVIDLARIDVLLDALQGKSEDEVEPLVKNNAELEHVLIQFGIISLMTAWEVFVEDTLLQQFQVRLERANSPDDMRRTFNSVATAFVPDKRGIPDNLIEWAGDKWKNRLLAYAKDKIRNLDTPMRAKVIELFDVLLDVDIWQAWTLQTMNVDAEQTIRQLDELMDIRGEIVHKGNSSNDTRLVITVDQLRTYSVFVQLLADATTYFLLLPRPTRV